MKIDVIHRHDPGGPEASIDCDEDGSVLATWQIEGGQLLDTHPELNTGGYVYFTLDSEPINVITQEDGGDFTNFSGRDIPEGGVTVDLALGHTELGVVYRAHILLAYEDGSTWHNDTQFICETAAPSPVPATPTVETLPFTGFDLTGLLVVGSLLLAFGMKLLKRETNE